MKIEILRVDGSREQREIPRLHAIRAINKLIGCDVGDAVNLRDGRVMCVDDTGMVDGKPVNRQATELYQSVYRLALENHATIHGDVAIAMDEDLGMSFGGESGSDNKGRVEEARRLLDMIDVEALEGKDHAFVSSMLEKLDQYGDRAVLSARQIFWLRDIKDRML